MNPALALVNPTLMERGMRSLATNAPLGIVLVGCFAAIHMLIGWKTESEKRSLFLKTLAESRAPNALLRTYMDAKDPIGTATEYLLLYPDEESSPLRAALAATL